MTVSKSTILIIAVLALAAVASADTLEN